ncbi:TraX family protein [Azohydromonas australica]|uniref:TraX family protein n=2 Tax=Azohydromonas australica TaxID=364039 RepID=UPI00040FCEBC|nr:TraX family protein [Azohydromonas australica]
MSAVLPLGNRRPLALPAGSVETLKWLALVLMVLDHVNTYLLGGAHPWMFAAGRTVMPVFSMVLAYNLAHAAPGAAWRTARRALAFGLLATPAFWALRGGWWPLNIMFALAASAAAIGLLEQQRTKAALTLAAAAGMVVEFWWPVIGATVAAWYFWRSSSWQPAVAWALCMLALTPVNGNCWAFGAIPMVAVAAMLKAHPARVRWVFYIAYPLHLTILWSLK